MTPLSSKDMGTIAAALRVAAEVYLQDAYAMERDGTPSLANVFHKQRAKAIALFERIEAEA